MNQQLIAQLEAEASRANTDYVANWAGTKAERIADLVEIALNADGQTAAHALWALEKVAAAHHNILLPHISAIVATLPRFTFSGMRRIACKILMLTDVPQDFDGPIIDFCFRMLETPDEPIGVKANCMSLIASRLSDYPELKPELKAIVDSIIETSDSKGFVVRARKFLK
ncbi:MAG: hypothetical protein IKN94_10120 [Salinivirgaceae bacterium]|nr:hypothetical protein [Salinivirgaceae bacterium]